MLTVATAAPAPPSAREQAFWRVFQHLSGVIAELETEAMGYRELLQLALAQQQVLERENYRLRASREAEAAIRGGW